jgi:excisionase family DNA binding protein
MDWDQSNLTAERRSTPGQTARSRESQIAPLTCAEKPCDEIRSLLLGLRDSIMRLESRLANQTDAPAYSISQAAEIVNLSDSHIRRVIYKRELPAANVGSTARPLWRIMRSDLIAWMESKKGGDPKIPPRSDLKVLIDRHLPGLRGRKESATR